MIDIHLHDGLRGKKHTTLQTDEQRRVKKKEEEVV